MSKYKCILFDLDGTLADTFPGILHSYQYAARKIGFPEPDEQIAGEVIGAPLAEVFRTRFGLSEDLTKQALHHYRLYYAENGIHEAILYQGMVDTLAKLKQEGYFLAVATLKKESFAKEMLKWLGVADYFDVILGMNDSDTATKADIVNKALTMLETKKEEAVLVGDSSYDAIGADLAGVDFIAVTYGFGYKSTEDVKGSNVKAIITTPTELMEVI